MLVRLSVGEADLNARYRERRRRRRRQIRIRRAVALGVLLALGAGIALGARAVGGGHSATAPPARHTQRPAAHKRAAHVVPDAIRGVHVTMALASLPGRLQQYLAIPGLNAIELDVKDENGHVGPGTYYKSRRVARVVH